MKDKEKTGHALFTLALFGLLLAKPKSAILVSDFQDNKPRHR
jgi:hypothetical protein